MSCIFLVWSFFRLARIVQSLSTLMPNKVVIMLHITAYLLIIVVNVLQFLCYPRGKSDDYRAFEISSICSLVVYFVYALIFGIIINIIVTKIVSTEKSETRESITARESERKSLKSS